jgi:hypothetical protein
LAKARSSFNQFLNYKRVTIIVKSILNISLKNLYYILLTSFLVLPAQSATLDDYGDNFAASDLRTVNFASTDADFIEGSFDFPGDVDLFKIIVPSTQTIRIETIGNVDPSLEIYDSNINKINFDQDNGEGKNILFSSKFEPGTYFVRLQDNAKVLGFYDLELTSLGNPTDDAPNGFKPEELTKIQFSASNKALKLDQEINYRGDLDMFYFNLEKAATLLMEADFDQNATIAFNLFDGELNLVNYVIGKRGFLRLVRKLAAGDYYLRVQAEGSAENSYTLKLNYSEINSDIDGGTLENISKKKLDYTDGRRRKRRSLQASMNYRQDLDLFRILIPANGILRVNTSRNRKSRRKNLDLDGRLLDFEGKELETDNIGDDVFLNKVVAPGEYFLEVTSNDKTGKYRVQSSFVKFK